MLKTEMEARILELEEENAKLKEGLKQAQHLIDENQRLREYCEMANSESQTANMELSRVQEKLNQVFEDYANTVNAMRNINELSTKNLRNSMQEEAQIKSYNNKKVGR